MPAETNIDQLVMKLQSFFEDLLLTQEMKDFGSAAGHAMKVNVIDALGDHVQSGQLRRALWSEEPEVKTSGPKATKKKTLTIGYGDNDNGGVGLGPLGAETLRSGQNAQFWVDDKVKNIKLRGEKDLPSWIILEFGRRAGNGQSAAGIPSEFVVPYTPRDQSKAFLVGPSVSFHFNKPVFFMSRFDRGGGFQDPVRYHPGFAGIHFFQNGLKNSKEEVNDLILDGLVASARTLAKKYGGEVK